MGVAYQWVQWNKHKKIYDLIICSSISLYLIIFTGITLFNNSEVTFETTIIRAFGSLAILLLHLILLIGPLCRLNKRFLPLLYNRRHLGVSMFLAALIHGGFALFQFHALGNTNPIYALFTSNPDYTSFTNFPFQVLGFLALLILFAMASTSHDFYLKNLSPTVWKKIHMLVYLAYLLIIFHVFLGSLQQESSLFTIGLFFFGFLAVSTFHLTAAFRERNINKSRSKNSGRWLRVCEVGDIKQGRAKIFTLDDQKVAIFRYDNKLSAVDNFCKHQGGPLGEGKIIDGCITCPWHGYQYYPHNGQSPPPFTERIKTFPLQLKGETIYLNPQAYAEGTEISPLKIFEDERSK